MPSDSEGLSALPFEVRPKGAALAESVNATSEGRTPLVPITIVVGGLSLQPQREAVRWALGREPPEDKDLVPLLAGPFCASCRRAVPTLSFTEWSTAEARDEALPPSCGSCGQLFVIAGAGIRTLKEGAARALRTALRAMRSGIDHERG
jgi:hypothetical protein